MFSTGEMFTSGVGLSSRGCFLFYTEDIYRTATFPYSVTANTLHELGHVLVRQHAPDDPAGADADSHQAIADCLCIMSYRGCYGEYCGRCVLAFRGWKTKCSNESSGA